ncbi:hypothetical protein ACET3Z_018794 [Daucus carota]
MNMDGTIEESSKAVATLSVGNFTAQPVAGVMSKNALKKELRNKQKEDGRRRKEEEKAQNFAATASSHVQNSLAADGDDMDPVQYFANRIKAVNALKTAGINPYPHKFHVSMSILEYEKKYSGLNSEERLENVEVSLTGIRILKKRSSSAKLFFYDLHDVDGAKVQLMLDARIFDLSEAEFEKFHGGVKRGDVVGVVGFPGIWGIYKSKRGELSIFPTSFTLLSHCLRMLPCITYTCWQKNDAWIPGSGRNPEAYVLKDQEIRYRHRCLDLMLNIEARHIFKTRTKVIPYVRRFLDNLNCQEVETPMISMIAEGAVARPFETYHNDLDEILFMRIAPELSLKQLVVGGFERVYEIGKQFRNEGIDLTHNPEYTTCECYIAYEDYNDLMEMTENIKFGTGMVKELTGGYKIKYHANGYENEAIEIDFTPPFRRIEMIEDLEKMAGINIPKDLSSDEANKYLAEACAKFEIKCPPPLTTALGHFLEETCVNPTFIINHPQIMSPLAKWHRSKPGLTERFELFVNKFELCNAYTELNDPEARKSGDDEAMDLDETFCTALEYGLPPTAGWGMGIDRLVMLLTDSQNIKEVILFSAMKPQNKSVPVKNAGQVGVDKRKSQDNAGKGFINSMKSLELRAKKPRSGERKL